MKRIIQIAVVSLFTLGQLLPSLPMTYAGEPIYTSTYDTPPPEIAIDTNTQAQGAAVAPTEATDTARFLTFMDANPISRAAEEAPEFILPGDVNHDLKVDSGDLIAIFQVGKYETGQTAAYEEGDIDGNGLVESADLVLLMQNYEREVLYHMAFGDGTLVIEKNLDRNGEIHTFVCVFIPTSEEPFLEVQIKDDFTVIRRSGPRGGPETIIRATKVSDGLGVEFQSEFASDGSAVSYYEETQDVPSPFAPNATLEKTTFSQLLKVTGGYVFKPHWMRLASDGISPNLSVDYRLDMETGEAHITKITLTQPPGTNSPRNSPIKLFIADMTQGRLLVREADGSVTGHTIYDGPALSFDRIEFNPASGMLMTLTAETTDFRKIRVVVTDVGMLADVYNSWPKKTGLGPLDLFSMPTIADIDGDGDMEILMHLRVSGASERGGAIYAFHHDGRPVVHGSKGVFVDFSPTTEHLNTFAPTITDLDGDGDMEIVFVTSSVRLLNDSLLRGDSFLYVYSHEGVLISRTSFAEKIGQYWAAWEQPTVAADLDGDGEKELVVTLENFHQGASLEEDSKMPFAVFSRRGDLLVAPPPPQVNYPDHFRPGQPVITAADINGDGTKEIILKTTDRGWPLSEQEHLVTAYDRHGNLLWSQHLPAQAWDILACDVDGDNISEVLAVTNYDISLAVHSLPTLDGRLVIFDGDGTFLFDEQIVPRVVEKGSVVQNMMISDLNQNGVPELIFATRESYDTPPVNVLVYAYEIGHGVLAGFPVAVPPHLNGFQDLQATVVADVNGDGSMDIVASRTVVVRNIPFLQFGKELFAWGKDGNLLEGWPKLAITRYINDISAADMESTIVQAGDLDNDGELDLSVTTPRGEIHVIDLDSPYRSGDAVGWGTYRYNSDRTGEIIIPKPSTTLTSTSQASQVNNTSSGLNPAPEWENSEPLQNAAATQPQTKTEGVLSLQPTDPFSHYYNAQSIPFSWVPTRTWTKVVEDDEALAFNLPFSFPFFGESYERIYISSNGFAQLGDCDECSDYTPDAATPNTSSPNAIIAPLWRDLNPFEGGRISYSESSSKFIVTWDSVPNLGDMKPQRFQLILENDGSITFQYQNVTSGPATVMGIEDATGKLGVNFTLLPENETAIKFFPTFFKGTALINQDASYTSNTQVNVTVGGTSPNAPNDFMRFSMDQGRTWTEWEPFATTKTLSLPSGDGRKEVYAQLKDRVGFESIPFSDAITLDTTGPVGSISMNNDLSHTNSVFVQLGLALRDRFSGLSEMRFSLDNGITWTDWEAFQSVKRLELPPGDEPKEVRAQVRDKVGNVSTFMDSIIFDPNRQLLQNQNLQTFEGVHKVMILGQLLNQVGNPITYQYEASQELLQNGRFTLIDNQLTYLPNDGFTGSGTIQVKAIDGVHTQEAVFNLEVKPAHLDTPKDPYFNLQYGLHLTNAVRAWNLSRGAGINVAIIDTGIDKSHPDLNNNIFRNPNEIPGDGIDNDSNGFPDDTNGWDFVNHDNNPSDDKGHGTHVGGIVAAEANNGEGIAGIAPDAGLIPVKALDWDGHGDWKNIISAINYAVQIGARVINMSLWGSTLRVSSSLVQALQDAIAAARQAGTVVVAIAGNDYGLDVANYIPAGLEGIVTVGATDSSDMKASLSNIGDKLEVVAPGVEVLSTIPTPMSSDANDCFSGGFGYACHSGTSMAAPFVSGLAALMLSQDPLARDEDIVRRLKYSSVDLGDAGFDPYYGYGRIDAFKALSYDYYEDGTIKTQWLEEPDEHGWSRLDFDPAGRFLARSVTTSGVLGVGSSLASDAVTSFESSISDKTELSAVTNAVFHTSTSFLPTFGVAQVALPRPAKAFSYTPLIWNALTHRSGDSEPEEKEESSPVTSLHFYS